MKNRMLHTIAGSQAIAKKAQKQIVGGGGVNCHIYEFYCSRTNRCYATPTQCNNACKPFACML